MKPTLMDTGDRVKFRSEKQGYSVMATSQRYSICTKPFNIKHTVLYTIIDWHDGLRGTEDLVFGMGAETQAQCDDMLKRLTNGESEISRHNYVELDIQWIRTRHGHDLLHQKNQLSAALV